MREAIVRVSWIDPLELIEHEFNQLAEEGRSVADLQQRWETVKKMTPDADALRNMARAKLDELAASTTPSLDDPIEPSSLEKIMQKCQPPQQSAHVPQIASSLLADRIAGGWFGRAAGCLLGKPVEKTPRAGIKELLQSNGSWPLSAYVTEHGIPTDLLKKHPWNRHSGRESLRENIVCMAEDDDMNYPMLNLSVVESAGGAFTTEDIASAWLTLLPVLSTFTAERVAYVNLLEGLQPPQTAIRHNPYREWIGAQIRGDVFGWIAPGNPQRAASFAYRDARLSHVRNGIYGEMFVAAMILAPWWKRQCRLYRRSRGWQKRSGSHLRFLRKNHPGRAPSIDLNSDTDTTTGFIRSTTQRWSLPRFCTEAATTATPSAMSSWGDGIRTVTARRSDLLSARWLGNPIFRIHGLHR
jgi:hypothetical protein